VGDASSGLELLLSHNPTETSRLARELDLQNRKRQELEAIALGEAEEQVGNAPPRVGGGGGKRTLASGCGRHCGGEVGAEISSAEFYHRD